MPKKYSSLLNKHTFLKYLYKYHDEESVNEILNLSCNVTEKIDGENFRIGINKDGKTFIGQKNGVWYDFKNHPNYRKFDERTLEQINIIKTEIIAVWSTHHKAGNDYEYCYYGEMSSCQLNY